MRVVNAKLYTALEAVSFTLALGDFMNCRKEEKDTERE